MAAEKRLFDVKNGITFKSYIIEKWKDFHKWKALEILAKVNSDMA